MIDSCFIEHSWVSVPLTRTITRWPLVGIRVRTVDTRFSQRMEDEMKHPMKVLAIDLGGTHAHCAIVKDREVVRSLVVQTVGSKRLELALPTLAAALNTLADEERMSLDHFAGVAVGFCGLVDSAKNRVISTNAKYEDAPNLDLQAWAKEELALPLWLENDARMALLGEWYAGAAAGSNDVVMVTLGTGIGGAAMMDGRLLTSKHSQAGSLGGHFPVRVDGRLCTCGAIGCAESEAAGWSLPGICCEWPGFEASLLANVELNFENLFRCADAGDTVAVGIREHCLKVWAANAVALIHAYDPELLIYGGGVMRSGEMIVKYMQDYVARYAWTPWGHVQVRAAKLGNNAALLGAVPLIAQGDRSKLNVR
jgi:glucokinase